MFGLGNLSKNQRLVLGVFILLLVDIIWVATSEVTKYVFAGDAYDKPYFRTYLKTSMFITYMFGFLIWRSWRLQCKKNNGQLKVSDHDSTDPEILSSPVYVPVKFDVPDKNGKNGVRVNGKRSVRFKNLSEVRQLSDSHAEEAVLARLSYSAYLRAEEMRIRLYNKLSVKQVAKLAAVFFAVYFFGHFSYHEALKQSGERIVNVLSSTSGLFTLVLAAMFPSSSGDRFTLSKFVAVLLSIGGVMLISFSGSVIGPEIPLGSLWALGGSIMIAVYLVLVRRRTENEDKLNIPMFFGFVGLFSCLVLWPGFFILHFSKAESFEWPDKMQWIFLVVNGLVGTVFSELLWLWGCFLTSSLVATMSISLTVPMNMIADIALRNEHNFNWMFYVGIAPVFLAFFACSIFSHYDNWDPVLLCFKKLSQCILRKRLIPRLRELDREQTESLININSNDHAS